MSTRITATRLIRIDAAHRVPTHGSKCAGLHGHSYTVELTVSAPALGTGKETGMVADFSVLKRVLELCVDAPADHGLIIWEHDPWLPRLLQCEPSGSNVVLPNTAIGKAWVVPCVPTAENLALLWRTEMTQLLAIERPELEVVRVRVYETPNCWADA